MPGELSRALYYPAFPAHWTAAKDAALPLEEIERICCGIINELKTVYDPEIPVDIYELGLIYNVGIDRSRHVTIDMTLTAPACPVAGDMPSWVEAAVCKVAGVRSAKANLVFQPPWNQSLMSDEARLQLNML